MNIEMNIDFDTLLTAVLAIGLIIQTSYFIKQTNHARRSSQVILTETWRGKLNESGYDQLQPGGKVTNAKLSFFNVVAKLSSMHNLFRDKILKPSDFADVFLAIYGAIIYSNIRKTSEYKDNYLRLQQIFHDFNDADTVLYMFDMFSYSDLEEVLGKIQNKTMKYFFKQSLRDWTSFQAVLRISLWLMIKIRKTVQGRACEAILNLTHPN